MPEQAEEATEVVESVAGDETPQEDKAVETEGTEAAEGAEQEATEEASQETTSEEGEQETEQADPELEELKPLVEKFKIENEALKLPGVRKALKSQRELEKLAGRKRDLPPEAKTALEAYNELRAMVQEDPEFAGVLQKHVAKHRRIQPEEDPLARAKRLREEAHRLSEAGKGLDAAERIAEAKMLEDPSYREFQQFREQNKREREAAEKRAVEDANRKVEEQWSAFEKEHGAISPEVEAEMVKTLESLPPVQRAMLDLEGLHVLTEHRMKKTGRAPVKQVQQKAPPPKGGRVPPKGTGAIRNGNPKSQPIPQEELDALKYL